MMIDMPINSKSTYFSDEANAFRLAVSTGNYLGFGRKSEIRKNDSVDSFEEILRKARVANVDLLLLGGNLFEEPHPDQSILQRTMTCFKEHIFGDKPIAYEIVWGKNAPNYACENMNIDLPIFVIHGRKEVAFGNECNILEVLHAGNYINYFGKLKTNQETFEVPPVLIMKGETRVALYGIGNLKESLFVESWKTNKFRFLKPENHTEFFKILIFHQNIGSLETFPEPGFFDLVISAGGNESCPKVDFQEESKTYQYRPGSSIITSFIASEGEPKHFGTFHIRRKEFQFEPIFLFESRRELLLKEISPKEIIKLRPKGPEEKERTAFKGFEEDETEHIIEEEFNGLLKEYQSRVFDREFKKLPLIRILVEYSGFDVMRIQRLENKFRNKVANEGEILKFWKRKDHKQALEISQGNINLNENFEQCFRAKQPFNTIGKEAVSDIRQIYEKDLKICTYSLMNPSLFLEKLDNLNFRNRNSLFSEFFLEIIAKISNELIYDQKSGMFSINNQYNQKNQYIVKKFKATLASASLKRQSTSRSEPSILSPEFQPVETDKSMENWDYQNDMRQFFESIKGNLNSKAIDIVEKVFKEFQEKDLERLSASRPEGEGFNQSNQKKKEKKKGIRKIRATKSSNPPLASDANEGTHKKGKTKKPDLDQSLTKVEEEDGRRRKTFVGEECKAVKEEENLKIEGSERNMKKRKNLNEFSEFLEKGDSEIKQKKTSRVFL